MSYKKVPWCNPKLTPACAALKASDLLLPKVHGKHTVLPKHCCASSNESPHVAALLASHVHCRRHEVLPRHTETHLCKAFGTSLAALRLGHRRYSGQPTAAAPALLHAWALQQALTLPLTCRPLPPLAAGSLPQGASPPPGCPLTLTPTPGALCVACTPHASSTRRTFSAGWGAPPVAGLWQGFTCRAAASCARAARFAGPAAGCRPCQIAASPCARARCVSRAPRGHNEDAPSSPIDRFKNL